MDDLEGMELDRNHSNLYKNTSREAHILDRRRRVAGLRLRGLSKREIVKVLGTGQNAIVNPETGKPYELTTIHKDTKWLENEWKQSALADLSDHKSRHFAELQEVKRAAWHQGKIFYVLKALEQEAALLGLNDLPEVPGVQFNVQQNFDLSGVSLDDLERLDNILDAIGVDEPNPAGELEAASETGTGAA